MLYFNDLDDEAEIIRPGKMLNDSQLNMYHAKEKVIVSLVWSKLKSMTDLNFHNVLNCTAENLGDE